MNFDFNAIKFNGFLRFFKLRRQGAIHPIFKRQVLKNKFNHRTTYSKLQHDGQPGYLALQAASLPISERQLLAQVDSWCLGVYGDSLINFPRIKNGTKLT